MLRRKARVAAAALAVTVAAVVPAASAGAETYPPASTTPDSPVCQQLRFPTEQAILWGGPAAVNTMLSAWTSAGCGEVPMM